MKLIKEVKLRNYSVIINPGNWKLKIIKITTLHFEMVEEHGIHGFQNIPNLIIF